jgi:hypothetical protein
MKKCKQHAKVLATIQFYAKSFKIVFKGATKAQKKN